MPHPPKRIEIINWLFKSLVEFSSEITWAWILFLQDFLKLKFNLFISYKINYIAYITLLGAL